MSAVPPHLRLAIALGIDLDMETPVHYIVMCDCTMMRCARPLRDDAPACDGCGAPLRLFTVLDQILTQTTSGIPVLASHVQTGHNAPDDNPARPA